jgi:hypothetical protein
MSYFLKRFGRHAKFSPRRSHDPMSRSSYPGSNPRHTDRKTSIDKSKIFTKNSHFLDFRAAPAALHYDSRDVFESFASGAKSLHHIGFLTLSANSASKLVKTCTEESVADLVKN